MGRRKNDENPVSLFAFQDIITSITGIMILVVLLIILDIIDTKETTTSSPSPYKEDIEQLEETILKLKEKLESDKDWLDKNEELIVKALSLDLNAIPKLIEKERKRNLLLSSSLTTVEKENIELKSMILKTEQKIKIQKEEETLNATKIIDKQDELKQRKKKNEELLVEIKKLQEEKEKRKNRVEIRTAEDLDKTPVFVEISENMIKTKVIKDSQFKDFISEEKDHKKLLGEFYRWIKTTRNPQEECIVVIVKPSSTEYAGMLISILKQENFNYNMEPMEETKTGVYE